MLFDAMNSKKLIVYGRTDCHLCQEMIASLQKLQEQTPFEFEMIDIDSDPELVRRYNERVPVLVPATGKQDEICHFYLDRAALDAYFAKIR